MDAPPLVPRRRGRPPGSRNRATIDRLAAAECTQPRGVEPPHHRLPILAILNCYAPASGANRAQIVLHFGGGFVIHGDGELALRAARLLRRVHEVGTEENEGDQVRCST